MKPGCRTGLFVARPARSIAGGVVALVFALVAAVHAQPASGEARVGILPLGSPSNSYDRSLVEGFRQGLRDAGLVEHRDTALHYPTAGRTVRTACRQPSGPLDRPASSCGRWRSQVSSMPTTPWRR
jgi:hypothetical protein